MISRKYFRKNYFWPWLTDTGLRNTVVFLTTLFILFPYFWMLLSSLKPNEQLMLSPPIWIPSRLVWSNYIRIFNILPLFRYMSNSVYVAVISTSICLLLSTMAAFSLSRLKSKIMTISISIFLFTQLIPFTLPMISFYRMMFSFGLTNTYSGLILSYSIWGVPFCTLMMRSYFSQAIPMELIESARIDGSTRWGTFYRIGLPLVTPGLVATSIFSFILAWNDFIWASIMLTDNKKMPVSIAVYGFIGQFGSNVNIALMMTTAVIITIPTMILFSFLQRHLVSGLTSGAVKG